MKTSRALAGLASGVAIAATIAFATGCASSSGPSSRPSAHPSFDFFAPATPNDDDRDPWYPKVVEWQGRMQSEGTRLPSTGQSVRGGLQSGKLLGAMGAYRDEERRAFAKRVTDWSQRLARKYYKWDPAAADPTFDHWPTVGELLATNGDDCDGLDLIAYQLLREFGFPSDRLFRAIIERNRDKANHMVTLWFEDPKDPWVIDATGAVTFEMRHFSKLEGWTPTKVFNERTQYTAGRSGAKSTVVGGE
jgi:hypothetical protein